MGTNQITFTLDGMAANAPEGTNLGAFLHLGHDGHLRDTENGAPRGLYCGMGVCFDCVVLIDGRPERACLTTITPGMKVTRTVKRQER